WLDRKSTSPPKDFTEATLLRAMETAGKQIEDEDLKEALKENGIGRPSTRAAIIETLYKRDYIRKDKKKIIPTQVGIDLIGLIKNPTLKSPELTGQWERKLRQIESGAFPPQEFLAELQQLVQEISREVIYDNRSLRIEAPAEAEAAGKKTAPKENAASVSGPAKTVGKNAKKVKAAAAEPGAEMGTCPNCREGKILKGKQAFGCSRWREGCTFRLPMEWHGKGLTDKQITTLLKGGKPVVKGLVSESGQKFDAALLLNERQELQFEKVASGPAADPFAVCPKCGQGQMLKGKTAYGCSRFREGCTVLLPFEIAGKKLTEKQIGELLLKGKTAKIKGFTSPKTGNKFEAQLILSPEGKVVFQF
ncbi:MAG TPA: topoisomerase C-terminal repeat-containing protein, partial [Adhaeribacter sp.]|nr:topoisomerase C-terminal repeat-containing protein [Adhaeribacter sp.]